MGILVVIVVIAIIVLVKRFQGEDRQMPNDNQEETSGLGIDAGIYFNSSSTSSGDTLPQ
jgi:hypothetical protein